MSTTTALETSCNAPGVPAAAPAERLLKQCTADAFEVVLARAEAACAKHHFGVISTIDLQAKLKAKGVALAPRCTILEVCNPAKAQAVLATNMDLASALPCRIALYTEGGMTVLSTLKPTVQLPLYGPAPGAADSACEVEAILRLIIADMAGA